MSKALLIPTGPRILRWFGYLELPVKIIQHRASTNNQSKKLHEFNQIKRSNRKTSLGHSSIYKFIAEGTFPKQVSLGAKSVAWLESEVDDWIMDRVGERDS